MQMEMAAAMEDEDVQTTKGCLMEEGGKWRKAMDVGLEAMGDSRCRVQMSEEWRDAKDGDSVVWMH